MATTSSMRIRRNQTSDYVIDPTFELLFELVFEILIRLPVKSLIRFKSVCKTWRQLIEDPNFIKKQHDTMSKRLNLNPTLGCILVITRDGVAGVSNMWLWSRDKAHNPNSNQNPNVVFGDNPWVVGNSHGLVWAVSGRSDSIICNPTTGHTREIPQFSLAIICRTIAFYGISFADNEYKLFAIVHSKSPSEFVVQAEMYSVSTNLWRLIDVKIGEFDARLHEPCGDMSSVVINDVFYWGAFDYGQEYMVTYFDMKSYICGVMKGPEYIGTTLKVIEFKGELALTNCLDNTRFNMWLLNEKERSWTKKLRVERLGLEGYSVRCLGRESNGNLAKKKSKLYNPESQAIMYIPAENQIWRGFFFVHRITASGLTKKVGSKQMILLKRLLLV